MARSGGVMSIPYPNFVNGTTADADQVDANNTDIVNELTNSIASDGQSTVTANIPMSTYKFTGLGSGSAATDSANLGQVQAQAYVWGGTAGGTADALTLTVTPAITAYAAGQTFRLISSSSANTGAATIAVSGLTTKALQNNGAALAAGDIAASKMYQIVYDGTAFQIQRVISPSTFAATLLDDATASAGATTLGLGTGDSPQFTGIELGHATDTTLTRSAAGRLAVEGKNAILNGQTDALTAGYSATPYNAGTKSSGTFTPDEVNGGFQYAVNGGAHTLAPPTNNCSLVIQYTNNASAGAVTTSGFTKVTGSTITTTNGDDFFFYITVNNGFKHLAVQALQ